MGTLAITTLAAHLKAGSKEVLMVDRIGHAGTAVGEAGEKQYQLLTSRKGSGKCRR